MNTHVEKDECISCGVCPSLCPEVFEFDDDGLAVAKVEEVPEDLEDLVQEAAESCPTSAIVVN